MDFQRDPVLDELARSVTRFVEREVLPVIERHERERTFPHALIARMGELGFFGAAFGEEVGGSDAGFAAVATVAEEISRLRPEFGYAMNMQAMTCPFTIYTFGTDEQVMRFVPDLIRGRKIGMFALSEAGGGSDPAGAMQTTAVREGECYLLNGSKMWITFSDVCDTGVLFARTDRAAGHQGITAFIVEPKRFPGFRAEPIEMRGLSKCLRTSAAYLDDFEVPVENRLGGEGDGFKIAMSALDYGRLTVSARLTGLAQACYERSIAYARERVVGGQAIGRYQMVQHQIADLAVEIEAARLLTQRTAWLMDQGRPARRAAAHSKYFAGRTARRAADAVTEIFGGYALADDYPVSYYGAYITMLCAGEGAPNVQRILIAEDALGYKDADRHPVRRRAR
ncbi:MAG: acyl-CoA dehydrogenase family protein [Geminicoccaceae bacterium]|nr:acyl-CoA dehydrogenase family protein [Geminicoccaceae bacterium]